MANQNGDGLIEKVFTLETVKDRPVEKRIPVIVTIHLQWVKYKSEFDPDVDVRMLFVISFPTLASD